MMAARRQKPNPAFHKVTKDDGCSTGIHPTFLKQARRSGQLNLSNRGLIEVPDEVWKLNEVPEESRNVSLDSSDDRWWEQADLTKLILASNVISDLTDNINRFPALIVLDVHDNRLGSLPEAIGSLANLQKLNVSHNNLKQLPDSIGSLKALQALHVQHNEITEITDDLGQLTELDDLDLSHNKITGLPITIGFLTHVRRFNISNNVIKCIPHEISLMAALRTLDATHNQIHTLPDELGDLQHLEQLYLRHNRLTHLPLLTNCILVKEVHLGNNALQGLTLEHLQCMRSVTVLDLRDNKIVKIPDEIELLQDLERLDLTNNDLSALPFVLGILPKLKSIVLDGNPLKSIRRDIVMRGTNELKKYLSSRMDTSAVSPRAKVEGLKKNQGESGIIGGTGEGVDVFTIHSTKALDWSNKKTAHIPNDLWPVAKEAGVGTVNFCKNLLQQIPPELATLSSTLTVLELSMNKISELDPCIGELTKLLVLDLGNNQLSTLPDNLSNLTHLRELVISFNRFREFPNVVYSLLDLEILLGSDNQVQSVDPIALQKLSKLSTVDLKNNDIMHVPPELGLCTQLRSLQLEGNPFRQPRTAILTKGTVHLLEYLRDRIVT